MIIIADSSPLIALAILDQLQLLTHYFDNVFIPYAVYEEVCSDDKPHYKKLKIFLTEKVVDVKNKYMVIALNERIDMGESQAITLALESNADFILLDDLKARKTAIRYGLKVIGSLGILLSAKKEGKIKSLSDVIQILMKNNIRLSDKIISDVLKEAGEID